MKKRILTIGNVYECIHADISSLPSLRGENYGSDYYRYPSGGALTSAVTMSRLGADVLICAKLGNDPKAKNLLLYMQQAGIETQYVKREKNGKSGLMIDLEEKENGIRRILIPMSNNTLCKDDIEYAFTSYPEALYIQNELSDELMAFAFEQAKKCDTDIFYQPCKKKGALPISSIPHLKALILDDTELYSYSGKEGDKYENLLPACISLSHVYDTDYIIIRISERGSFIYDGTYHNLIPNFPTQNIDTRGCRQIFGATVCADYIENENIRQAVCLGNISYAIAANNKGEASSAPFKADIRRYMAQNGIKID